MRKLKLDDYDPRYDPAVIPISEESSSNTGQLSTVDPPYRVSPEHPNRQYSIADYHSAFEAGKLTPLAVAEALLELSGSSAHKVAFLSVKKDQVLSAAQASTQRYKEGKSRGILDGVPLAVKGTVLLILQSYLGIHFQ